MITPDANLLLYAYNRQDPNHSQALGWWTELVQGDEPVGLPWLVAVGFVRLATGPVVLEKPLTPDLAIEAIEEWLAKPQIELLTPGPDHLRIWGNLIRETGAEGNLVSDAHIAALAIEHDAVVHTNDRDLSRFPGLRWQNPLQAPA